MSVMLRAGLLMLLTVPTQALALSCTLSFDVTITHGIGRYPPGTALQGSARFETRGSFRQEGGATAHLATGTMTLDGQITGRLWTVITTSRAQAADLVGLYALDVEGLSFVGQAFTGPMAITLYGARGSWPHDRPPITQAEWDSLRLRRVFQLHAPASADMLGGDITALDATCLDFAPGDP